MGSRSSHRMGGSLILRMLPFPALLLLFSASPLPEIRILRRPQQTPRDAREVSSVCSQYVKSHAPFIPAYCNLALATTKQKETEMKENTTVLMKTTTAAPAHYTKPRQMKGWGWSQWTEWDGCGSCPRPACPSSCRMRCRFCHGVCPGQASQLDSCPSLSPLPLSSSPPHQPTTTTTRRPLPALEGDAVMGMETDLQDWFPSH